MDLGSLFFSFAGRINRAKFWGGYLGLIALSLLVYYGIVSFIGEPFAIANMEAVATQGAEPEWVFNNTALAVYGLLCLLTTIMGFALIIKRCHDRGKSGWWSLITLIPLAGFIWMLIDLGVMEGQKGPNKWGPNPLGNQA